MCVPVHDAREEVATTILRTVVVLVGIATWRRVCHHGRDDKSEEERELDEEYHCT